ncbi:MAG: fucose isomerase [Oligoflexales bacterium]|nr:fucose isomerase [Oligoflexales bacterium]
MKYQIKLGVVCLARKTFDFETAHEIYRGIKNELSKRSDIGLAFIDNLIIEADDAVSAAHTLVREEIDALVCISGTFNLGHLALELNKRIQKPMLLMALEELPYDGGKIRLNSVCGVNLNASNLYKSGIKNYHVKIGNTLDEDWLDAIRVDTLLSKARVGILGFRAHGFFNLGVYDPGIYSELGILVDYFDPAELMGFPVPKDDSVSMREKVSSLFDLSGVSEEQVARVSDLSVKFRGFMKKNRLDALAVRCWPEFAANYGISPCAAMSIVQSEDMITSCEGDIEGAISMLAQRAAGGTTPFLFDFSQVDFKSNHALLWHCGVAPANLWDGRCKRSLDTYFAGGRGVTADFVLKEGDVSILRFDFAPQEKRLFLLKGKGIAMDKQLKGSYLKTTFDVDVRDILKIIVDKGIAHHASMVYGDYIEPFKIYAKMRGYEIVSP